MRGERLAGCPECAYFEVWEEEGGATLNFLQCQAQGCGAVTCYYCKERLLLLPPLDQPEEPSSRHLQEETAPATAPGDGHGGVEEAKGGEAAAAAGPSSSSGGSSKEAEDRCRWDAALLQAHPKHQVSEGVSRPDRRAGGRAGGQAQRWSHRWPALTCSCSPYYCCCGCSSRSVGRSLARPPMRAGLVHQSTN